MKISVLIIAHNEDKYIERCIESVLRQVKKADEIVLIAHNCTDKTIDIARHFTEVKTIPYNGPSGVVNARIFGFDHVSGDMILCIDGDSYAESNWIEEMSKVLINKKIVGSLVKFKGTVYGRLNNLFNRFRLLSKNIKTFYWVWGPSFAINKKEIPIIKDYLIESEKISKTLGLKRNPEDFTASLLMYLKDRDSLGITTKTFVTQNQKEKNSLQAIKRSLENNAKARVVLKNTPLFSRKSISF